MPRPFAPLSVVLSLLCVTGCGTPAAPSTDSVSTPQVAADSSGLPTAACADAFRAAAGVNEMQDTWSDYDDAVANCTSVEDWIAANEETSALDADPVQILLNRCNDPAVPVKGPACDTLKTMYPDGLYDEPYTKP